MIDQKKRINFFSNIKKFGTDTPGHRLCPVIISLSIIVTVNFSRKDLLKEEKCLCFPILRAWIARDNDTIAYDDASPPLPQEMTSVRVAAASNAVIQNVSVNVQGYNQMSALSQASYNTVLPTKPWKTTL